MSLPGPEPKADLSRGAGTDGLRAGAALAPSHGTEGCKGEHLCRRLTLGLQSSGTRKGPKLLCKVCIFFLFYQPGGMTQTSALCRQMDGFPCPLRLTWRRWSLRDTRLICSLQVSFTPAITSPLPCSPCRMSPS